MAASSAPPISASCSKTARSSAPTPSSAIPHTLSDTVHYGYRLGTKMGTPTINMQFPDGVLVPRHGVYAAKVYLDDGSEHYAVTNVGVRPTVSGGQRVSVESFILDYEGNLYNRQVRLEFYKFLRPEQKFDSVDALKARILYDADTTRAYFEAQDPACIRTDKTRGPGTQYRGRGSAFSVHCGADCAVLAGRRRDLPRPRLRGWAALAL